MILLTLFFIYFIVHPLYLLHKLQGWCNLHFWYHYLSVSFVLAIQKKHLFHRNSRELLILSNYKNKVFLSIYIICHNLLTMSIYGGGGGGSIDPFLNATRNPGPVRVLDGLVKGMRIFDVLTKYFGKLKKSNNLKKNCFILSKKYFMSLHCADLSKNILLKYFFFCQLYRIYFHSYLLFWLVVVIII